MMAAYTSEYYYHYLGGLTTPTCDEVVNWFSVVDPILINQAQFDEIAAMSDETYHETARETLDYHGRVPVKITTTTNCSSSSRLGFFATLVVLLAAIMY